MDKYEYRVKTEQMLDLLEKKEYQKAMDIAESIDWRRVKNASMLNTVSEIYEYNGEFKKGRDILFLAFDRAPGSRKIVYRLGTLALKIKDIREATDCYEEFVKLAPKDPNQYILKYKILRTQGAALSDQIAALEEFKKAEYIEKWAYELAKLYDEAGMTAECLEECDDLILWFSEGKYVYLAMELKMKYKPLTPLQQEKYDSRPGAVKKQPEPVKQTESTLEEVDDENEYDEGSEEEVQESTVQRIDDAQVQEIPPEPVPMQEEFEIPEEAAQADVVPEEVVPEATAAVEETPMYREEEPEASVETPEEHTSAIKQVVTGATLEEALAQGVAVASGINIEEEAMKEREDEILANGQMMIDDILQKWEAKQKDHEEAIAKQKAKDEERLQKEREQARIRQEEERKEVERKAAEAEARRKAEEEAARKAAEEAAKKAAAEEAAKKAQEEANKKAADEAAKKAAEASKKSSSASGSNTGSGSSTSNKSNSNTSSNNASSNNTGSSSSATTSKNNGSSSSSSSGSSGSSVSYNPTGQSVVNYACQFVGNPYVWGGTSLTNGADCSGFIMSIYAKFGVSLPHSSGAMAGCGRGVSYSEAMPGDIICYAGHVAIYMGGGQIVHASNAKDGIKISGNAAYRPIVAVRRVL